MPIEFDALMTDERIKPCEVRPGQLFDMGGGRNLRTMAGSGGVVVFPDGSYVCADNRSEVFMKSWPRGRYALHLYGRAIGVSATVRFEDPTRAQRDLAAVSRKLDEPLAVVIQSEKPVSHVCNRFEPLPQILKNVRYKEGKPLDYSSINMPAAAVANARAEAEQRARCHGASTSTKLSEQLRWPVTPKSSS